MSERRYDPTVAQWRIIRSDAPPGRDADGDGAGAGGAVAGCAMCAAFDPGPAADLPRKGYRFAVLSEPASEPSPGAAAGPAAGSVVGHAGEPGVVTGTPLQPVLPVSALRETILYTDRHDHSLGTLAVSHLARLVDVWADRYATLGARDDVAYVYVFEQHTPGADGRPAHPHGRVHTYPDIPPVPLRELQTAQERLARTGTCVYCDLVAQETASGERLVAANVHFVAFVPFAARFPYEVHVLSRRHATSLLDLTDPERTSLAELVGTVVAGYETVSGGGVPYLMAIHQAPTDEGEWLPVSHFHIEFTPEYGTTTQPRYLAAEDVGVGIFVNHTPPEVSADRLRRALTAR